MNAILRKFASAFVLLLPASVLMGQVSTGTYHFGTYDSPGIDTINVGNLNVNFSIQILNKTGRGAPFNYSLNYDNSVWAPSASSGSLLWTPVPNWGWQYLPNASEGASGYVTENVLVYTCTPSGPPPANGSMVVYSNVVYYDNSGGSHPFPGSLTTVTSSSCAAPPPGAIGPNASDGSGYQFMSQSLTGTSATGTATIQSSNGTYVVPVNGAAFTATRTTDNNGNQIIYDGYGHITDTTGVVALTLGASTLQYTDTTGTTRTVTVTYAPYTVQTNFECNTPGDIVKDYGPLSQSLVSSISFPDGSTYNFNYEQTPGFPGNVTGRLAGIQLPQGDWIYYTYNGGTGTNTTSGIVCADGSTAGLTRTLNSDSGSASSTWTYTRTSPNGAGTSHTEVVDGFGNHKAFDFVVPTNEEPFALYYETNRMIYQGAESGTPVVARSTCYNGMPSPCVVTPYSNPMTSITMIETLDGIETHGTYTTVTSVNGSVTGQQIFGFGGSASPISYGPTLKTEAWTYNAINNELAEDEVWDGSNNLAAMTTYSYDVPAVKPSSGVPNFVGPIPNPGNLTSAVQTVNSAGTQYTTNYNYEDTGTLLSTNTMTWTKTLSYDPTFTYPLGTKLPTPSSGVALSSSATYDTAYTGLPLTTIDPNGRVTTIKSYDSMLRPLEVDSSPDGGKTTYTYSVFQPGPPIQPAQVEQRTYQSASVYSDAFTQYDGYGRVSRIAVANGQSVKPWYQTDTCYDTNGNVVFQSYPYQGAGFGGTVKGCSISGNTVSSTVSGDTYTYDVLGRATSITRGNGELISYTYLARATQSADANGVTRISQVDGLGRPTIVCEVSSDSENMVNSGPPASCGTDIPGMGYVTSYAYSNGFTTTTILQGAQPRTIQTDFLGRPISVTEPERGTTTYSYTYNATGLQVTRTRPKANTTTQYDALGRVLTISYTDGITPTKTFAYDTSTGVSTGTGAKFSDLPQANLKGRLSLASVPTAMTAYSYDPVGRISALDECLPSGSCGTTKYNHLLLYTYDQAGNMLTSTDGNGVKTSFSLTVANELSSMRSSISDTTDPLTLVSSVQNSVYGPTSYNLGNGLSSVSSYDTLGRLNGRWVCAGSTQAKCSGSSVSPLYGFTTALKGAQLSCSSETVLGQGNTVVGQQSTYGYDEFNRLASSAVNSYSEATQPPNYTWTYDRYGNRWSQTPKGTGYTSSLTFGTLTNRINTTGYVYDAAGNLTNDSLGNTYTYDAEGNILTVSGNASAAYTYNALNQRVETAVSGKTTDFVYNAGGQRVSEWNATAKTPNKGKYYWGGQPVAYYTTGTGAGAHFEHQDWLGTERVRTTYNSTKNPTYATEGTYSSLPWGDGKSSTGADIDARHYAQLDHDTETDTDHAQFRQYSNKQGRWFSPDPYDGSYDMSNPQSMNRYVYAMNSPLSYVDPSGLDGESIFDELGSSSGCYLNGGFAPCSVVQGWMTISMLNSGTDMPPGTVPPASKVPSGANSSNISWPASFLSGSGNDPIGYSVTTTTSTPVPVHQVDNCKTANNEPLIRSTAAYLQSEIYTNPLEACLVQLINGQIMIMP